MIPLSDSPKARTRPYVNIGIIVACCAVFVYQLTLDELQLTLFFFDHGVVPLRLVDWLEDPSGLGEPLTVVTSAFIHAGWLHLFGNMIFLWVFGDNIEDAYGHMKYAVFYVVCAAGAVAVQVFTDQDGLIPMVGASGAIAGVMGAYLMLYPRATVGVLIPWLFFLGTFPIPAAVLIGFWFAIQLLASTATLGGDTLAGVTVAYWAHVGGFVTGAVITLLLRSTLRVRPSPRRGTGSQVW